MMRTGLKIVAFMMMTSALVCGCTSQHGQSDFWSMVCEGKQLVVTNMAISSQGLVYIGTERRGLYYSADSGKTCSLAAFPDQHILCLAAESAGAMLVGTDKGLFRISSPSETQSADTLIKMREVWSVAAFGLDLILADDLRGGTSFFDWPKLKSSDRGRSWVEIHFPNGESDKMMRTIRTSHGDLYTAFFGGNIVRSTDEGDHWQSIGLSSKIKWHNDFAVDSAGCFYVATLHGGLYRSSDNGSTWTRLKNGLPDTSVISIVALSANELYVSTYDGGGVFRSTDAGMSWRSVSTGLTNNRVRCLLLDREGFLYAGTLRGVFKSNKPVTKIPGSYPL